MSELPRPAAEPVSAGLYTGEYYMESCGGSEFFHRYGPEVLKPSMTYVMSRAGIRPGMRVLDVGCGRGEMLYQVRKLGGEGYGVDYAEPALEIARKVSGCPIQLGDAKSLPFPDAHFDRIFFVGVIDHLYDWELETAFAEMGRVLKPGGSVLVHTCTNRLYYKNWTYSFRRRAAGLLRKLGLSVADPSLPRTGEDEAMHVNEHSYRDLKRLFRKLGWKAEVECRPNYKMLLKELYGDPLPKGFPLKPLPALKTAIYLRFLWWPPLKWVLAREFFCVAKIV